MNYDLSSAKIFSSACYLYPDIKYTEPNHVDCVGNMIRLDAVGVVKRSEDSMTSFAIYFLK